MREFPSLRPAGRTGDLDIYKTDELPGKSGASLPTSLKTQPSKWPCHGELLDFSTALYKASLGNNSEKPEMSVKQVHKGVKRHAVL